MLLPIEKRWLEASVLPAEIDANLLNFPPVIRQILYNRGITTQDQASSYLAALPSAGCEPFNLKDLPKSVDRIDRAIQQREKITVYGDYDVDGVTASAVLLLALKELGADVDAYIPNRFDEGYGLNNEALDSLASSNTSLVITVDCGIRSMEEADHATRLGLDLILTDHHHVGPEIPRAYAIINPKQPGCSFPYKDLAGVGLAYKLAEALFQRLKPEMGPKYVEKYLDLVALGTVADLAPLTGENRFLVRAGLNQIRKQKRQGIQSLVAVSGLKPDRVTAGEIGFTLAPRLNAAGRLDTAWDALNLLTSENIEEIGLLAQKLNNQNRERQEITQQTQASAMAKAIAQDPERYLLFAVDPSYNPGIVGLAASRLMDSFYRPAIIAAQNENFTRGSCRSIPEFHITEALDQCSDLLVKYGGHAAAAGFTVENARITELFSRLSAIAKEKLQGLDLRPSLSADTAIELNALSPELLNYLELLQPTGNGNHSALFATYGLKVVNKRSIGRENAHLKLTLTDGWVTYDAIAFRFGDRFNSISGRVDIMYAFETNEFNGVTSLQLNIRDIRPAMNPMNLR